jgi:pimeloyl-ACP methyl ester carboxylesterase
VKAYRWIAAALVIAALLFVYLRPLTVVFVLHAAYLRAIGMRSSFVRVGPHRIHYFDSGGDGPPLVMVHGVASRAADAAPLYRALSRTHRIYALDLLGYGDSDHPRDSDYSVRTQAAVVRGFMDALDIGQADVMGISMGGGRGAAAARAEARARLQRGRGLSDDAAHGVVLAAEPRGAAREHRPADGSPGAGVHPARPAAPLAREGVGGAAVDVIDVHASRSARRKAAARAHAGAAGVGNARPHRPDLRGRAHAARDAARAPRATGRMRAPGGHRMPRRHASRDRRLSITRSVWTAAAQAAALKSRQLRCRVGERQQR